MKIIDNNFFNKPAIELAPLLLGKYLCVNVNGKVIKSVITETEAYYGQEDTACHSHKGKTNRTKVMWEDGGTIYVYLCYGIHYMFNIVCAGKSPQAVLIRGVLDAQGPGKLTKFFNIDKSINGENIKTSLNVWLEDNKKRYKIKRDKRIGINYASKKDRDAKLRFYIANTN